MKNRIAFGITVILAAVVVVVMTTACGSAPDAPPPDGPLPFGENRMNMRETLQTPNFGSQEDESGQIVYFISNAKSPIETGTYEILFTRSTFLNISDYNYLVFDIMTDNLELFDDIQGFFFRVFSGVNYVQFNGNAAMMAAFNRISEEGQWVTIRAPIGVGNVHANPDNFRMAIRRMNVLGLRFICNNMDPIEGTIYFRNVHFDVM